MRRVAEIIYVVESEREAFLRGALELDEETKKVLWSCGVRKQQYFALNELIFMTFEYKGDHFEEDMAKMAAYLDAKGNLIKMRRKDVPLEERATTNWWAPVKRLGSLLDTKPDFEDDAEQDDYVTKLDGSMSIRDDYYDISYNEDEWVQSVDIW
ncbi:MAG: hypothetical protein Q4D51_02075 [Eubacteriales bacterium]|nr:hypothetical protein [Eubacteriales bacterium]